MLLDVFFLPVDILLLDSQVNEKVINKRKSIRGIIRLIITKSSHHPTNKKPHECDARCRNFFYFQLAGRRFSVFIFNFVKFPLHLLDMSLKRLKPFHSLQFHFLSYESHVLHHRKQHIQQ